MKRKGLAVPMLRLVTCLSLGACTPSPQTAPAPEPLLPAQQAPAAPAPTPAAPTPAAPTPAPAAPTPAAPTPAPAAKSGEWTQQRLELSRPDLAPVTLREVRTARNEGFDRVVFQFDTDAAVPGYRVEYLTEPAVQCGSGNPVSVAGQGRLQVTLQPAQAHEQGQSTVAERSRKPALPLLSELKQTCDFEGEVTWVLGVSAPHAYRVLELKAPTRLVVDVQY